MWALVVRSSVLHCAVPLLFFLFFFSQCVWIIGSNNYIHLCPTVEAIYNPVTVVMTKSFIIPTTKQHLHIKLWWCGCRNVCLFCTFQICRYTQQNRVYCCCFLCVYVCVCVCAYYQVRQQKQRINHRVSKTDLMKTFCGTIEVLKLKKKALLGGETF